jgi:hypothetical protein
MSIFDHAGAGTLYLIKYALYIRKNAQVVTNLQQTCNKVVPTTCQQDVFALLVPNLLRRACYGLLTDL